MFGLMLKSKHHRTVEALRNSIDLLEKRLNSNMERLDIAYRNLDESRHRMRVLQDDAIAYSAQLNRATESWAGSKIEIERLIAENDQLRKALVKKAKERKCI